LKRNIAVVTHHIDIGGVGGGVSVFTEFLYTILRDSNRYEPEIISLATSAYDSASVRLVAPRTWSKGPQIRAGSWRNLPYRHVGVTIAEFEFQRYKPRKILDDILKEYDLVQVIGGTPAWGWVASHVKSPLCVFTATTVKRERVSRLMKEKGFRRLWLKAMTRSNIMIENRVLHHANAVFAESQYTYDNLKKIVPEGRLILGKPGVDVNFFKPSASKKEAYILAVGAFSDPRKNVRLLIKAYQHLCINDKAAPALILAGTPPQPEDMHYMAELGIDKKIELRKHPSPEELAELYRNAQFFVLSSDEEGLGIVVLEAMASGLPVVSTDCGGPKTAVIEGETGFLTPVGEAKGLTDAMQHLLDDPKLRQHMGEAGRQVVEEKFSFRVAGNVYLEKYDELLAGESFDLQR